MELVRKQRADTGQSPRLEPSPNSLTAYQAYPEEPHDASDKDLYSVQMPRPPDSLHDNHTESSTQEEASFNYEAISY